MFPLCNVYISNVDCELSPSNNTRNEGLVVLPCYYVVCRPVYRSETSHWTARELVSATKCDAYGVKPPATCGCGSCRRRPLGYQVTELCDLRSLHSGNPLSILREERFPPSCWHEIFIHIREKIFATWRLTRVQRDMMRCWRSQSWL